jgi:hypothetical protein
VGRSGGSREATARTRARTLTGLATLAGAAALMITGCGVADSGQTARDTTGAGGSAAIPATSTASAAHPGTAPAGSRGQALRLARKLLAELVRPAGSATLPQRPLPAGLRRPFSTESATSYLDIYRLFSLPVPMRKAEHFLSTHTPAGLKQFGTGTYSSSGRVTTESVTLAARRLPAGISSLQVVETIVPGPGGGTALLRADAQVIWYPDRSPAEFLTVASFRAVRLQAPKAFGRGPGTVTRTFTARAVIRRLVRVVDSLPASPGGVFHCPLLTGTYEVTFLPRAGHALAVVSVPGCAADDVTVGGVTQPALADFGRLTSAVRALLHLGRPRIPVAGTHG